MEWNFFPYNDLRRFLLKTEILKNFKNIHFFIYRIMMKHWRHEALRLSETDNFKNILDKGIESDYDDVTPLAVEIVRNLSEYKSSLIVSLIKNGIAMP